MGKKNRPRLAWIMASLRYSGQFGVSEKKDYAFHFGIGSSQVGRDQDEFLAIVEGRIGRGVVIKERGKLFLADAGDIEEMSRLFPEIELQDWLRTMLRASFEAPRSLARAQPPSHVLREIVGAIRNEHPVEISYRSRGNPEGKRRLISPHTIVDVAGRYHVRAFDHGKTRWTDFVLTRMEWVKPAADGMRRIYRRKSSDLQWHKKVRVEVRAREKERTEAVRMDFGLDASFSRRVRTRAALASYLVDPDEAYSHPVEVRLCDA